MRLLDQLVAADAPIDTSPEALVNAASEDGTMKLVALLLDRGADVNAMTKNGTALMRAAGNNCPRSLYVLLAHTPKLDLLHPKWNETARQLAEGLCRPMLEAAEQGRLTTPFELLDLERIRSEFLAYAANLAQFATRHSGEEFYAAAIDGGRLRLNSLEAFEKTLATYQVDSEEYRTDARAIRSLKHSPGDWSYSVAPVSDALAPPGLTFDALVARPPDLRIHKEVIVDLLHENRDTVFKSLHRTDDFSLSALAHQH